MTVVFQDAAMGNGGAEAVVRSALKGRTSRVVVGVGSPKGLDRLRESGAHVEALVTEDDFDRLPQRAVGAALEGVLGLTPFDEPLLSFHHRLGLLATSSVGTVYYMHSPTRFLHEQERVANELSLIDEPLRQGIQALESHNIHRARSILTNSRATKARIEASYDVEAQVLHPPTSLWTIRRSPTRETRLPPRYILTVSRLSASKGILDALIGVKRTGLPWLIVGDGDPKVRKALRGHAFLLGSLPDSEVAGLLARASVALSPALEDFGLFAAEALTFGVPTVARRGSGVEDISDALHVFDDPLGDAGVGLAAAIETAAKSAPPTRETERVRDLLAVEPFQRQLWDLVERL